MGAITLALVAIDLFLAALLRKKAGAGTPACKEFVVKKRYWLWNALILALVFGFTARSIAKEQNFALLPRAFALMRVEYIVAGALLSLWYVLCESIILKLMFWREKRRVSF